jgi:hypothetical protein
MRHLLRYENAMVCCVLLALNALHVVKGRSSVV